MEQSERPKDYNHSAFYHGVLILAFPLGLGHEKNVRTGVQGDDPMTAHQVGDHIEVEAEEVRAGQTGTGMRYVLAAGVVLVVIGFASAAAILLS
jgi:hypothetical protein